MGVGGGSANGKTYGRGEGRVQRRERKGKRKWGAEEGEEGKEGMGGSMYGNMHYTTILRTQTDTIRKDFNYSVYPGVRAPWLLPRNKYGPFTNTR